MLCDTSLCIYWNEGNCILNEISIDSLGMCDSCIYVDIDEAELSKLLKKQLLDME